MLLEHEGDYGLGMDVKVTVCSGSTNEIMVWAWMQRGPYSLGARRRLWFGHGCNGNRMLLEHEGDYGLGMDVKATVCSWSGARRRLWFGHVCKGNRMLLEHEGDYGLGMDVKVTVCSGSTNEIMVWAWMQRGPYSLGARRRLWFGHGCNGNRMLLEHEGDYGLGMDVKATVCSWSGARRRLWFGHGCNGNRMLLEHERDCGFIPPQCPPHPRCKNLFNHTASYRRRVLT